MCLFSIQVFSPSYILNLLWGDFPLLDETTYTTNGVIKKGKYMGENASDKILDKGLHICRAVDKL